MHTRNPNSPDVKDWRKDCTNHPEFLARRTAWTLHKELYKIAGAHADVRRRKFFQGHTPVEEANTSKYKPIVESKDRLCNVDGGAYLHLMAGKVSLSTQKRKTHTTQRKIPQTAKGIVPSTKKARGYKEEFGTRFYVKVVQDSPSVLSLGRLCDELAFSLLLATRRKPRHQPKARKPSRATANNFVLSSSRSLSRRCSISQARPRQVKPCAIYRRGRNHGKTCWTCFLKVSSPTTQCRSRNHLQPTGQLGKDLLHSSSLTSPIAATRPLSVVTDAGGDHHGKDKKTA